MKCNKDYLLSVFLIGILMISLFVGISPLNTSAQENLTASSNSINSNITALKTSNMSTNEDVSVKMAQISNSDKPEDIAALAYIWGYPLITMQRSFDYFTSPDTASKGVMGSGPSNDIHFARELVNASFKDVVAPNADTLYGQLWANLTAEPLVLQVPPIEGDRYYSFEFLDAYTNDYAYVGSRATGFDGGTYLIAGPTWNGKVPDGMAKIWAPTDLNWIINRVLVKDNADVSNVNAIQDQIKVMPLSSYLSNSTTSTNATSGATTTTTNKSNASELPINPAPRFIPTTGIKIYDEIGAAMVDNPLNPPDPALVTKLAGIGIGPGKVPSQQANDTIKAALETGITEGEKLIAAKVANFGIKVNGWTMNAALGVYATDYLTRAATTQYGFGANIGQEAFYPVLFTDSEDKLLSGANNYTIHFEPAQLPPVHAFWSITLYNNKTLFVDNPINRYSVGMFTGLKNNTDGSVDIYIQNVDPGPEREPNWLPAPQDSFSLLMRLYVPESAALDGTWTPPPVIRSQ
jgi:hypothetical protein